MSQLPEPTELLRKRREEDRVLILSVLRGLTDFASLMDTRAELVELAVLLERLAEKLRKKAE